MPNGSKRIKVSPGSELARLLEEAAETVLLLEKDGVRYQLKREDADEFQTANAVLEPSVMTLEAAYGSVPALPQPFDLSEVERIAKEEHVQQVIRKMQRQ